MKLAERTVTLLLSEEGHAVLEFAGDSLHEVYVTDTDDIGIWARIGREDGSHLVLIRWEYVISVDIRAGEVRKVGLGN